MFHVFRDFSYVDSLVLTDEDSGSIIMFSSNLAIEVPIGHK